MNTELYNSERRVQGGLAGNPVLPGFAPSPLGYDLQLTVEMGLTDLEKEVIRLALNEYRFMLSHQIGNVPEGHVPPTIMSMKFVDAIAAKLMERFRTGATILDGTAAKTESPTEKAE